MNFCWNNFRPGKQDYLFRHSVIPGNFPFERPEKLVVFHFTHIFENEMNSLLLRLVFEWNRKDLSRNLSEKDASTEKKNFGNNNLSGFSTVM